MEGRHRFDFLAGPAVLIAAVAALALWDRRVPQVVETPVPPVVQEKSEVSKVAPSGTSQAAAACAQKSADQFRKAWGTGAIGEETAEYVSHYNAKLDACFYLLTIIGRPPGETVEFRRLLADVNEAVLYGEYHGPENGGAGGAALPERCVVEYFYCASRGEWDRMAGTFMEAGAAAPTSDGRPAPRLPSNTARSN